MTLDWQTRINNAIQYMETHLGEPADIVRIAKIANCSAFHFMRMFEVITGISPAEYIRRRRLSLAALKLVSGREKILDIALAAGYDSPDSFSRAFRREFNCTPSKARQEGTSLHAYPPLSFSIVLKGDKAMEFRIEEGPALTLTGISITVNSKDGSNLTNIPRFWDDSMQDGRLKPFFEKAGDSALGVCGVCHSFDMKTGNFVYSIAIEKPRDTKSLPKGCTDIPVPASTWGKFTSRGPMRKNFQETIKRIFSEWFPASGREHSGAPEIEYYPPLPDHEAEDYWCEYWVPLK
ncbi:AraC family transcriptional regulator [Brucepastera parasyntrophica]|uniref:AraC family transcriptional regulator n=1 Tax=Brucepastera parasyntrophica TaxID=2880008 RepID=UPI00210DFA38|nr:AraC family transcriptional regulator [Brucepastera parasyntrophica]ULQ58777.1 AraC family transcriptional regulator [Brucepastera parasyntrophica]